MNKLDPRNIYDDLHQIPELGFEEFKTSAYLADKLEAMGYKVTRNIGGTGVIGEIKGSEPGPVMMLRADMDALPFLIDGEKKNIHACGHDAHSAMLLAAASELVGKVKRGTLRILFQQGEETLKGALAVIDAGVIEDVDIALGLHIRPVQDIAYGEMSPAVRHASSTFVNVVINGLSRLPVASSARITAGLFTNARAMATRCICPPDIWLDLCSSRSPSPTAFSASMARFRRSAADTDELYISGSSTFSTAVVFASRL